MEYFKLWKFSNQDKNIHIQPQLFFTATLFFYPRNNLYGRIIFVDSDSNF